MGSFSIRLTKTERQDNSTATQTWTLDVAGLQYVDKTSISHVINTNETLTLDFIDEGVGGVFRVIAGGGLIGCTDGYSFEPHSESRFEFRSSVDGSATLTNGEIAFIESDGALVAWRVISITLTNADGTGSNNVVEIIMEQVRNPANRMTWTNINTA